MRLEAAIGIVPLLSSSHAYPQVRAAVCRQRKATCRAHPFWKLHLMATFNRRLMSKIKGKTSCARMREAKVVPEAMVTATSAAAAAPRGGVKMKYDQVRGPAFQ